MNPNTASVSIPVGYDPQFLMKGVSLTYGYGYTPDGTLAKLEFAARDYVAVVTAVEAYPVRYLEVALPQKLTEISRERDRRIANFTYGPFTLDLSGDAKRDLCDAVVGLRECPDVLGIDWSVGEGEFVQLDRDTLIAVAQAAFRHIQATFAGHRRLATAAKAAANIDALAAIEYLEDAAWAPETNTIDG